MRLVRRDPGASGGPHAMRAFVPGEPALSVAEAETMSLARVFCPLSCRVLVWLGGLRAPLPQGLLSPLVQPQ